jgi:hypothetical protein
MMDYRSKIHKFSKGIGIHLRIIHTEMLTWSKCHTADQQILGATICDTVVLVSWHSGFVCPCHRSYSIMSRLRVFGGIYFQCIRQIFHFCFLTMWCCM